MIAQPDLLFNLNLIQFALKTKSIWLPIATEIVVLWVQI